MNTTIRLNLTQETREKVAALAAFIREHGRFPYTNEYGEPRRLRMWALEQGRAFQEGTLGPRIIAHYDEQLPGWTLLGERTGHEPTRFHERAQECAAYYAEHGKYPSKTAKDPRVRSLGLWLHHRRLGAHGNGVHHASNGARVALMDRLTPGWDTTKSEVWVTRARALIEFVYANSRYPGSSPELPDERVMYEWLYKFQYAVTKDRRGGNPWQVEFMDLHLPGWQSRTVPSVGSRPPASLRDVWRAPRQGDIVNCDGRPALAIRPNHNPTSPVEARLRGEGRALDAVPHRIRNLRSARTVSLAQVARAAEDKGNPYPYDSVDLYLAETFGNAS